MNYNDIIGHKKIISSLQNIVSTNKISHSYLFYGEESVGKKELGLVFAKTLLCQMGENKPCDKCISCQKFDSDNHPDFWLVGPEKNIIKKEKVDEIISSVNTYPLESKRKLILIDDSDKMGIESQNALLKTLEEPPEYINIILITGNDKKILPTIRSRCQTIKFTPVSTEEIGNILVNKYGKTREDANFIAHFTKGSVGRSIDYAKNDEFFIRREKILDIIDKIVVSKDTSLVFSSYAFFKEIKDDYIDILDMIIYWFRDLYLYKEVGMHPLILNKDRESSLERQTFLSFDKINDIIENIIDTKYYISMNINYQLGIEAMLLNMQEV